MKKIQLRLAMMVVVIFTIVGCQKDHEQICEMDSKICMDFVDKNGEGSINGVAEYRLRLIELTIYDRTTNEKQKDHLHKTDQFVNGLISFYLSPDICDRTFPSVRAILKTYLENIKTGEADYYIADTIDAELEYLATDKCYLKSYSLNGVPQWYRDTCTTDYYRSTRICTILIDSSRFIEKKPL